MKERLALMFMGAATLLLLTLACNSTGVSSGFTKIADAITNPDSREVYAREFRDDRAAFDVWEAAHDAALADSLIVNLPYGEKGVFVPFQNAVYTYTLSMKEGEVLEARVVANTSGQRIFMEIYHHNRNGWTKTLDNDPTIPELKYPVTQTGDYKVVIQPEIAATSNFFLSIGKKPQYGFPVAGKGNAAILSFWGMERDGGKRLHEGIDIFANRGTPVIAAVDGTIGFTGERGIGGKQVWLHDGLFGNSLYYAHLDAIKVESGERVRVGDTLGFVGNTGNAKSTQPHLHFGIYKSGAIDPLPFVYLTDKATASRFAQNTMYGVKRVKGPANLRQGPATSFNAIGTLAANDTVLLLGRTNDWFHIQTPAGQKAFLHKSLIK